MIMADDCSQKSLIPLMDSIREQMGSHRPVYFTFDIDGIDPAYCPGTGQCILECIIQHECYVL